MCDSDKLRAGRVWIHSHSAHESLVKSFGVSIEEYLDLAKIPELFMKAWGKYHHPILPLGYALNPEYHRMKSWLDPTVKKGVDTVLKKQFPDVTNRAKVKAAFTRYCNHEGAIAKLDDEGAKRDVWTDEFMTAVAPCSPVRITQSGVVLLCHTQLYVADVEAYKGVHSFVCSLHPWQHQSLQQQMAPQSL